MITSRKISDVQDKQSEAAIIATLLSHPDFVHHSEDLSPRHFFDEVNGLLYFGIKECVLNDIKELDAVNISTILNRKRCDESKVTAITNDLISSIIDLGKLIQRHTVEEYLLLTESVIDKALKRDVLRELSQLENICYNAETTDAREQVYNTLERIVSNYNNLTEVKPIGASIDSIWSSIQEGWEGDDFIDFKFPTLNHYCRISRTDCLLFAAREKRGKSIMLLNCLVDLLRKGMKILYIDTELDTKLFIMRLLAHLTQIHFKSIRDGQITDKEKEKINSALKWIKSANFTHIYMPVIEDDKILAAVKTYKHKYGLDGLILDYLKGNGKYTLDAYQNSAALGKTTDLLKNIIAGKEKMFVLGAVQATSMGGIADSAKIARNCSAMMLLERKSDKEIINDGGLQYGNTKLAVIVNRNGEQHGEGEYMSLTLTGNTCTFEESLQPIKESPY